MITGTYETVFGVNEYELGEVLETMEPELTEEDKLASSKGEKTKWDLHKQVAAEDKDPSWNMSSLRMAQMVLLLTQGRKYQVMKYQGRKYQVWKYQVMKYQGRRYTLDSALSVIKKNFHYKESQYEAARKVLSRCGLEYAGEIVVRAAEQVVADEHDRIQASSEPAEYSEIPLAA